MKFRIFLIGFILFIAPMIFTISFASTNEAETPDAAKIKKINSEIARAIEKAQKEGRTSVDINLDEIDLSDPDQKEIENQVQNRDVVNVDVQARLSDGTFIIGSEKAPANLQILAGSSRGIPGVGKLVLGMTPGQSRSVALSPDQVFGPHTNEKARSYPLEKRIPLTAAIDAKAFKEKTGKILKEGQFVQLNPYFKSRVSQVTEEKIVLENLARDGLVETAPFGKTRIFIQNNFIYIRLEPTIGADFFDGQKTGIIVSADKEQFVVDYNHPHAGKSLTLTVKVHDLVKASIPAAISIPWIDDHDAGYEAARKAGKNKVLILYADWCRWCKKLFNETLIDPRIKLFNDDFIWVKANSDNDPALKSLYHQEGFPMIVITDKKGIILHKSEGFKNAEKLLPILKAAKSETRKAAAR